MKFYGAATCVLEFTVENHVDERNLIKMAHHAITYMRSSLVEYKVAAAAVSYSLEIIFYALLIGEGYNIRD